MNECSVAATAPLPPSAFSPLLLHAFALADDAPSNLHSPTLASVSRTKPEQLLHCWPSLLRSLHAVSRRYCFPVVPGCQMIDVAKRPYSSTCLDNPTHPYELRTLAYPRDLYLCHTLSIMYLQPVEPLKLQSTKFCVPALKYRAGRCRSWWCQTSTSSSVRAPISHAAVPSSK